LFLALVYVFIVTHFYVYKRTDLSIGNLSATYGTWSAFTNAGGLDVRLTEETADKIAPHAAEMANSGSHVGSYFCSHMMVALTAACSSGAEVWESGVLWLEIRMSCFDEVRL
jgi:hypothetical protein